MEVEKSINAYAYCVSWISIKNSFDYISLKKVRTKIRTKAIQTKFTPASNILFLAEIVKALLEIVETWLEIVEYKP